MKKRIISLILVFFLLLPLLPAARAEEKAAEPGSIEAQIHAYADSIDQSDAVSTAAMALAMHGITGGGKKLVLRESSALAALLLNSEQFQYMLVRSCTNAIRNMQELDMDTMENLKGSSFWDGSENRVSLSHHQSQYPGSTDWSIISQPFPGEWNAYDRALEWMAGITAVRMWITRTAVSEDTAVYRVDCRIVDTFDFSTASSSGFKEFLSGIGMLLFQEYEWECNISFTLEVPYSCPHSSGAYHWTYDPEEKEMISDSSNGYTENTAEHRINKDSGDYFALDETVRLLHDRPWVLEYDAKNLTALPLVPVEVSYYVSRLMLRHSSGNYIMLRSKRQVPYETEEGTMDSQYIYGTGKAVLSSLVPGSRRKLLTYRMENQVYPDGSNMIFLTILDPQAGTVLVDRLPMDDYYETYEGVEGETLISEESDWLSGQDIYINYIGNYYFSFGADHLDLRVWENGVGGEPESHYQFSGDFPATCTETAHTDYTCSACGYTRREYGEPATGHHHVPTVTEATCTEAGFTAYRCACGDSYVADHTEALGHDLTEWAVVEAVTCTGNGLEERHCRRCVYSENRIVEAKGHNYVPEVIEPSCTVGGYTEYTCVCGNSYRTSYTNPTGHHYEGVVTAPGCTERGFTTYTCTCGDSYTRNFTTALGHDYAEGICTRCGVSDPDFVKPNPFTDVPAGSFFYDPVLWALENGITTGAAADLFDPNGQCQRAQVVTFLWRAAGSPEPVSTDNPFEDVKESDFYYKAVLWAVEKGITTGTDAAHFNPFGICNRAQVVTFLHRAFGSPAVENGNNPFSDVPGDTWYTAPVLWAVENSITNGLSDAAFGPDSPCNRAQVVTFLYRSHTE